MVKIKSVRDLGRLFVNNNHRMVGQDGAYSIPLHGRTLWYFGDTLIGERTEGESLWYPGGKPVGPKDMSGMGKIEKMINNTGLIIDKTTGRTGLKNYSYILDNENEIKPLIPLLDDESPDEIRIWCLHGVKVDDKIYLYFIKVRTIEEGIMPVNFEVLGSGLAVGKERDWNFKRVKFNNSHLFWKEDEPKFASAILKSNSDDWLYLYGVVQDENSVQQCYLSRVKKQDIEKLDSYEYLVSPEPKWSKNVSEAKPVFSGMPNELSVSHNKYLKKYMAVHSLDLTGNIVARVSDYPWGPWSEPNVLYKVEVSREKDLPYPILIYAGKEHPEISEGNGKVIYVTYIEFEEYYPHLIEIELE